MIWVICILVRTQVAGEELLVCGDVMLQNHVLQRSVDGLGSDSVDTAKGQSNETAGTSLVLELTRDLAGQFDSLILNGYVPDLDIVRSNGSRRYRTVSVLDVPGASRHGLEGGRVVWIEDRGTRCFRGLDSMGGKMRGPGLCTVSQYSGMKVARNIPRSQMNQSQSPVTLISSAGWTAIVVSPTKFRVCAGVPIWTGQV